MATFDEILKFQNKVFKYTKWRIPKLSIFILEKQNFKDFRHGQGKEPTRRSISSKKKGNGDNANKNQNERNTDNEKNGNEDVVTLDGGQLTGNNKKRVI